MKTLSMSKDRIAILLLEGIHGDAAAAFEEAGYTNITQLSHSLTGEELHAALKDVHFLGIRSRTQLDDAALRVASKLAAVGCFCIGTNQVDLSATAQRGIPVFNAPFSNTRSVAELVLAEIIMLMRGIPQKNAAAHRGRWLKSALDSSEIRGKRLGIVGYGHIGTQLGILAENLGMRVSYFDIETKLPLGNASPETGLMELLTTSDVVSLHVPQTPETENMIGARELAALPHGGFLINASRGNVVDIDALAEALQTGQIGGAALDVFPTEPKSNDDEFESPLRRFDNVLITPHIGGSTQEAQRNIALEVAGKLVKYSDNGSTFTAVNFPAVSLPEQHDQRRLLHVHRNQPGVLESINHCFSEIGVNISAQYLQTTNDVGYVVMDVDADIETANRLLERLRNVDGTIRARILH